MIKNAFMGSERMIKIAVVEDNKKDQAILTEYLKKFSARFEIETFDSAVLFLTDYKPKYDIVFMDIEMPYLDGMSAAAKLRQVDNCACLIFVTNLAQYAIKGYEVAAFDYIVKPLTYANFAMKMTRILTHIDTKTQKEVLVRTSDGIVRVDVSDIIYVEIAAHKITYHLVDKNVESYGTLKDVETLVDDKLFVRCNNCFLVNLRFVNAIEDKYAVVGEERLLISYPRRQEFKKALTDYLCGASV